MAFFDFDRRIQTILIAGALAAAPACGTTESLQGETDARSDTRDVYEVEEPHIDPPPDAFEVPGPACPDPDSWAVTMNEHDIDHPELRLRVFLNLDASFVHDSSVEFSAEKKEIVDVIRVSPTEYEIAYRWTGPLGYYFWDWDRIHVSWDVTCSDDAGTYTRTLTDLTTICVGEGYMYLGHDDDPDVSCTVDDCLPDAFEAKKETLEEGDGLLTRGLVRTSLLAVPGKDGIVNLRTRTTGPLAADARFEWTASGGTIAPRGKEAVWHPPAEPGVHTIQVAVRSGTSMSIEAYRHVVKA